MDQEHKALLQWVIADKELGKAEDMKAEYYHRECLARKAFEKWTNYLSVKKLMGTFTGNEQSDDFSEYFDHN